MSLDFIACRGEVYIVKGGDTTVSQGYKLEPSLSSGGSKYPILLTNASVSENDLILPAASLSNHKIIYTFGTDFGNVQIQGSVFLGPSGRISDGLSKVISYYQTNSVNNKSSPISLSMPGGTKFKFYLTRLDVAQARPELNMHDFVLSGLRAEPPN